MFQGASAINLDAKGRMSIPAKHRDALAIQCEGRLTLTKHPDGCLLGKIYVPEKVGNLCFGGTHGDQLFITASTSLYRITLHTQGN